MTYSENFLSSYLREIPDNDDGRYIFLVSNSDLAFSIIDCGFNAVALTDSFGVDEFSKCVGGIENAVTTRCEYTYVLACSTIRENDVLQKFFKDECLQFKDNGWQLFRKKDFLSKSEHQAELKKILANYIDQFEGGNSCLLETKTDSNGNQKTIQSVRNFETAMEQDTRFSGKIKFDEFSHQTYLIGDVPWENEYCHRAWSSYDDSALFSILQSEYELRNRNDYFDALKNISMRHKFHPVRDVLDSLQWDGKEHIRQLLPDYLGVEDTEYAFQVMRLWMLGAVARVFQPGCKFDYTMILQGPQGIGKSSFLRFLALRDEWFNDSLDSLDSDKAAQSLMGSWIIELAELKSLARTIGGTDSVKRFLTATQDKHRLPYARRADIFLRQCVFSGTTNKSDFLHDETGNRRFLIIQTGINEPMKNLFSSDALENIKAAWSQAVHIWKNENPQLILPDSCREEAQRLQEDSMVDDGKAGIITEYLVDKSRTCAVEIWQRALGEQGRPQKWQASEINNIILSLPGWEKMKNPSRFGEYGQQRGFQKLSTKSYSKCLQTATNTEGFMQIDQENEMELPFD